MNANPEEICLDHISNRMHRGAHWEQAKGHLRAMLEYYGWEGMDYLVTKELVEGFIEQMDKARE